MRLTVSLLALCALIAVSASASAESRLSPRPVVSGLAAPVHVTAPISEPGRLYVVLQDGRILVVVDGKLRREAFLDIRRLVRSGGEQGLLSVAFHPSYASNHLLYVDYTDRNGDTRVVEYRSDGTRVLLSTGRQLLFVGQPYANHNGGQLAFGPDGRLYVGMGDGGSGGDPEDRAQNPASLLGKLLAIDVNRRAAKAQLVGIGLRNPWRFSFDRLTGDLYIADVGQDAWEEIDYLPRRSPGLENYGWNLWEGRARFADKPQGPGRLISPVAVYGHGEGCSVTGGFVYRGSAEKALRGRYIYGDFCSGNVWTLRVSGGKAVSLRREPFGIPALSSFGEDAAGELYATSLNGTLYRLTG